MAKKPHQNGDTFFDAVGKAISYGVPIEGIESADILNTTADHVALLLQDAVQTFRSRSYGTLVFLAITAMEETAKAEVLAFRTRSRPEGSKDGGDPLRNHKKKHQIAVRPTTFMGRLPALLGSAECARLQSEAENGDFISLREESLYFHVDSKGLRAPSMSINYGRAREVLLLALECADDIIVGWTNHSFELGRQFEEMIEVVDSSPENLKS